MRALWALLLVGCGGAPETASIAAPAAPSSVAPCEPREQMSPEGTLRWCELAGQLDGPASFEDDAGRLVYRGHYAGGHRAGEWTYFHAAGETPQIVLSYLAGKPHGPARAMNLDGSTHLEVHFDQGALVGPYRWSTGGRLRRESFGADVASLEPLWAEMIAEPPASPGCAPEAARSAFATVLPAVQACLRDGPEDLRFALVWWGDRRRPPWVMARDQDPAALTCLVRAGATAAPATTCGEALFSVRRQPPEGLRCASAGLGEPVPRRYEADCAEGVGELRLQPEPAFCNGAEVARRMDALSAELRRCYGRTLERVATSSLELTFRIGLGGQTSWARVDRDDTGVAGTRPCVERLIAQQFFVVPVGGECQVKFRFPEPVH